MPKEIAFESPSQLLDAQAAGQSPVSVLRRLVAGLQTSSDLASLQQVLEQQLHHLVDYSRCVVKIQLPDFEPYEFSLYHFGKSMVSYSGELAHQGDIEQLETIDQPLSINGNVFGSLRLVVRTHYPTIQAVHELTSLLASYLAHRIYTWHLHQEVAILTSNLILRQSDLRETQALLQSAEEEAQFLCELIHAINQARDFEAALAVVLQGFCEVMNWQYGEAWVPDSGGDYLICSPVWYGRDSQLTSFRSFSQFTRFKKGEGLPGRVWATRQPEWIADVSVETETFFRADLAKQAGLKTGFAVAIVTSDQVVAVLVFFATKVNSTVPRLIEMLTAIATQVGSTIQHKQIEAALQTSEAEMRALFEAMDQLIAVINAQGRILKIVPTNPALLYKPAEVQIGKTLSEIFPPNQAAYFLTCIHQALQSQKPVHLEYSLPINQREVWFSTSISTISTDAVIWIARDVTEQKTVEASLRKAEATYRSIFENAVEGIFQTTPEGYYLAANTMLAQIYGYDSPQELMTTLTNIQHQLYVDPQQRQEFQHLMEQHDAVLGFESQVYRKDGSIIWILENARAIRDDNGTLLGYEGTVEDVTRRKQAEAELIKRDRLLQGLAEATHCLLTEVDRETAIQQALAILGLASGMDRVYIYENHSHPVNHQPAMSMRFEWTRPTIPSILNHPSCQNQVWQPGMFRSNDLLMTDSALRRTIHSCTIPNLAHPEPHPEQTQGARSNLTAPILVDDQFWGYIGFDHYQTGYAWSTTEESILLAIAASIGGALKRDQAEATIRYQAFHDLLTGLPNRAMFNQTLQNALLAAQQNGHMLAVMFLDLDRFKVINDTLGHTIGDQLLKSLAKRLTSCLREGDMVSRWGGDEFVLLLSKIDQVADAIAIAQRLIESFRPAFQLGPHEVRISTSVGIALYPRDGSDAQTLLQNADAAAYQVKDRGRNHYQLYLPAIHERTSRLLSLENHLYCALERSELILYYQPRLNLLTGQITGMEALIRWQHPTLGLVSPDTFIPMAENNGLITAIGEWVLRRACTQNQKWQTMGLPPLCVSVNLSARQFQQGDLVSLVAKVLAETQLSPHWLELEITESAVMQDVDFISIVLASLRNMGVHLSLDDFGTGYASLSYLKKFPFTTLKLDRSFVQELHQNCQDMAIVKAVLELGRGLNLNIVAEGVETEEQLLKLQALRCQEIQGYWLSKPMSAEAATTFLQKKLSKRLFSVDQTIDQTHQDQG